MQRNSKRQSIYGKVHAIASEEKKEIVRTITKFNKKILFSTISLEEKQKLFRQGYWLNENSLGKR